MTNQLSPKVQHHRKVTQLAAGWIGSADSKASALLSVAGVAMALVLVAGESGPQTDLAWWLHLSFAVMALAAVACSILALWPRTSRRLVLAPASHRQMDSSPTYFGDLCKQSFDDYLSLNAGISDQTLERDALEQSYILMRIAALKMAWIRRAIVCTAVYLVLLTLLSVTKYTDWQKGAVRAVDTNASCSQ